MFCDFQQDVGINAVVHVCELSEQSLCRVIQSSYSLLFCVMPFTHTHTFNGPFSGTTRVSRYQKGKTMHRDMMISHKESVILTQLGI